MQLITVSMRYPGSIRAVSGPGLFAGVCDNGGCAQYPRYPGTFSLTQARGEQSSFMYQDVMVVYAVTGQVSGYTGYCIHLLCTLMVVSNNLPGYGPTTARIPTLAPQYGAFDLGLLGFDQEELSRIMSGDLEAGLNDPNDVPAPPDAASMQPGDLWTLGNHRLLCSDSSKPADIGRFIDGAPIHLVNPDPPYIVKFKPRQQRDRRGQQFVQRDTQPLNQEQS